MAINEKNIKSAIAIMKRAKNFQMGRYQSSLVKSWVMSEEQLYLDGNTANLAGYIALSPEFQADGGAILMGGSPLYKRQSGASAVAEWLGIGESLAATLVYGDSSRPQSMYGAWYLQILGVHVKDPYPEGEVTAQNVVAALEKVLSGELT